MGQQLYIAKHTFQGQESQSQLSFTKGSIIICHPNNNNNPNDAWWLGSCVGNSNKLGWFPSSYVTKVEQQLQQNQQQQPVKLTMMGGPGSFKKKTKSSLEIKGDVSSIAMKQFEMFSLDLKKQPFKSKSRSTTNTKNEGTTLVSEGTKTTSKNNNDDEDDLFGEMTSSSTTTTLQQKEQTEDLFATAKTT